MLASSEIGFITSLTAESSAQTIPSVSHQTSRKSLALSLLYRCSFVSCLEKLPSKIAEPVLIHPNTQES